jgi:predicted permease
MVDDGGRLWRRLRYLFSWRRRNAELAEELAFHAELRQRDFERDGLAPPAARLAAQRAMGNQTLAAEDARATWWVTWLESIAQDLRYGARALRRAPGFATVAILGLAGGLGVSAALFSAYNALALRGFAVSAPDRIVGLFTAVCRDCDQPNSEGLSLSEIRYLREHARTLDGIIVHDESRPDGSGELTPAAVSANYFTVLGVPMARGRAFLPDEDRFESPTPVLVLSHRLWRERFDERADVVGQSVRIRGLNFTVVGVAAASFRGTSAADVEAWMPTAARALLQARDPWVRTLATDPEQCCLAVAARLAPGATPAAAERELTLLRRQLPRVRPDTSGRIVALAPFTVVGAKGPASVRRMRSTFAMIGGGVALVLLLACANVANLLLARSMARQREIDMRLALGASRARLVRQLLTEGMLLSLLAALPALALAVLLPSWILRVVTPATLALDFSLDWRVLAVTVVLAVVSCVLFSLAPALQVTRPLMARGGRVPLRTVFLSAQVAICLVLLVTAGLFLRSVRAGQSLELGYAADEVTELLLTIPADASDSLEARRWAQLLPDLVRTSGARQVAYAVESPLRLGTQPFRLLGDAAVQEVPRATVSPGYFGVIGQALLAGREFAKQDAVARTVIVNDSLAMRFGGISRAIGATLLIDSVPQTIVGVVRTALDAQLSARGPVLYQPLSWTTTPHVLVRGDAAAAVRLSAAMMAADPRLNVTSRRYQWYVDDGLRASYGSAAMAGMLGSLALGLAAVGMFGVFAFWVQQRRHEIGVRMALGATQGQVARLVLGATGRAIVGGLVVGLIGAVAAGQVVRSALYGVDPIDPVAFVVAVGVLVLSALVATVVPCWQAVHVDPAESLRAD